jgi:small subunit ribosomal protein S21
MQGFQPPLPANATNIGQIESYHTQTRNSRRLEEFGGSATLPDPPGTPRGICPVLSSYEILDFCPPAQRTEPKEAADRSTRRERNAFMIKVKSRGNETAEQMLRRFKKMCEKEGLTKDIKRVAYYEKPSEKRRRRSRKGGGPRMAR